MRHTNSKEIANRIESFSSDRFWNSSSIGSDVDMGDVSQDEVFPLCPPTRQPKRNSMAPKNIQKVQSLGVSHIIGMSHENTSTPLVFGKDGIVAYLAGCYVTLLDQRTNSQLQHLSLESRKRQFSCLAISDDGSMLAAGETGPDPAVLLWWIDESSAVQGPPVVLHGHRESITALCFSSNGQSLASVGNPQDSQLILWDCARQSILHSQLIHIQANLTSLSFSIDSRALYASGKSNLTMWNVSPKSSGSFGNGSGVSLTSASVLPSSEKGVEVVDVKAGPSKKTPLVFAVTKSGILYKLRQQNGGTTIEKKTDLRVSRAYSLAVDANKIAVACANGTVKVVRAKTLAVETTIAKPCNDSDSSTQQDVLTDALYCAFDHSASSLAVVYADNTVAFWDSAETSQIRCYHSFKSPTGCITDIFPIPSRSTDSAILDRSAVKAMRSPIHNPQAVESEFATCSDTGIINVWNLKIQTVHSRQQAVISQGSDRPGRPNAPRVQINMQTIDTNSRPALKSRLTGRRSGGDTLNRVKTGKETKKKSSVKTSVASSSKPKPALTKSTKKPGTSSTASTSKRVVPTKPTTFTAKRPTTKGKNVSKTRGSMRLSTGLSTNAPLCASVVAVPKAGPSKSAALDTEMPPTEPAESVRLTTLRVSPDGMHLVAGDSKGHLRIYHFPSRKFLSKKELHSSPITTIEFSLSGKQGEVLMATGAEDGSVCVIDVHHDFGVKLLKENHDKPVTGLAFSPEGLAVVSCGKDNYLYYESLETSSNDDELEEDMELFLSRHLLMTSTFEAMHFNAERNTYMLACSDNFIRVFNTSGQFVHAIQVPAELGAPTKILQGSIPSMIITCHENNSVGIFEYFSGRLIAVGKSHSQLTGALLINHGRYLVTTGDDGVMMIWEIPEEIRRRCMAAPMECGVTRDEAGYSNEFFHHIQREKERAARAVNISNSTGEGSSSRVQMEGISVGDRAHFSEMSTPICSRPVSRQSAFSMSMDSPTVSYSQPMTIPAREHVRIPSWASKLPGMGDSRLSDGFESRSPSICSGLPRLDLGSVFETDDEGLPAPLAMSRGNSVMNEQFGDFDTIPLDHFASGYSRNGLNCDNDRFHRPTDSFSRGRRSTDSFSGSPAFGLNPCTSLAQYVDERPGRRSHSIFDASECGFGRPSGPEPPSSVSCTSDSRTSTPFSMHPRRDFDAEASAMSHFNDGDGNDEQFSLLRSPYASIGPIGPNIRRIASRTPHSIYSDDKTVFSRPNSEEHANKMLAELRPPSDESLTTALHSPFLFNADNNNHHNADNRSFMKNNSSFAFDRDAADVQFYHSDGEETVPVDQYEYLEEGEEDFELDTSPVCCLNKNPLYSHRSSQPLPLLSSNRHPSPCTVSSDLAHVSIRQMATPIDSVADVASFEKEASLSDMIEMSEPIGASKCASPVRKSTDQVWKVVKNRVTESLQKLRDDIGLHESLSDCSLPTTRKLEFVDNVQHELASLLERLQGQKT